MGVLQLDTSQLTRLCRCLAGLPSLHGLSEHLVKVVTNGCSHEHM